MDSRNGSRDAPLDPFTIPFITTPTEHAYDSLADLFLGDGELAPEPMLPAPVAQAPRPGRTASNPVPDIEALILGHLPVLASPWVLQYARNRAAEIGEPVALLRLNSGTASVEVVGTDDVQGAPSPNLSEAIDRAKMTARRWLIRVDETNELALAEALASAPPATLTLLTGADDTAIAACYRTLKSLAEAIVGAAEGMPIIRVVVMGANADAAASAGRKIRQAATTFLGLPPELAQPVPRMVPARALNLYRGQTDQSAESLLALVRTPTEAPGHSVAATPPLSPSVPPPSRASALARTDALASLLPGLRPLSARSPVAQSVELATDADGRLHLIARADSPDACPAAAAELTAAAAWAQTHARLLGAAEPSIRTAEAPPLHLLTPTPRAARALVGSSIRVHALANANGAWAAVEL
ncbi:MAG TPA: hypothetical protein PLU35_12520 [Phycisphaerales bacterium]|nr:hypothetical protein [Phycisphaerales bacterium]